MDLKQSRGTDCWILDDKTVSTRQQALPKILHYLYGKHIYAD